MEALNDYQILEQINETRHSIVFRAQKTGDDTPIILKYLRAKNPATTEVSRLRQEYELIRGLDLDGVIQPHALLNDENGVALILEDFKAISLKQRIADRTPELEDFLDLAIRITEIIGLLHKNNVVHGDIKPDNILLSPQDHRVKISDFGIARVITHENEDIYHPEIIDGTLKYISPEQTGRMNRAIDYRTDLYSLGITFYEMLTGTQPFTYRDPMELIHAHIAREPVPPDTINPQIPSVLSALVLKLMAKPAEERYQNAFGLLHDLRTCLARLKTKGGIPPFELARQDISLKFNIPQQLVGREKEQARLLAAFERAVTQQRPETVLVSGYPGTGKSFLVNELHKSITAQKGYFLSGKYEHFRGDVPYSAIIQAFSRLFRQILAESRERLEAWRQALQNALGENGRLMTDLIPALKPVIGEAPGISELSAEKMENLFPHLFKNLIRVFATPAHPLVLLLDDLQWMDWASLQLIQHVISDTDIGCFCFIGAYRNNEIDATHMLQPFIDKLKSGAINGEFIDVRPLGPDHVKHLLGNFLRVPAAKIAPLAAIIHAKTNGNPFFINQFIRRLYEKKLLEMSSNGQWQWDEAAIRDMEVTDNVVDLMVQKINELPASDREILKIAACIGNRFDLESMSEITEKPPESILSDMAEALNSGLLHFSGNMCYFLHDRIQEAAYSLVSESRRPKIHYAVGMHTYRRTQTHALRDKIFYIVNQLNAGRSEITDHAATMDLASLNQIAGRKAKESAAYEAALSYLETGQALLKETDWSENYALCYELFFQAAAAAYLTADFSRMEAYIGEILAGSEIFLDRVKACEFRIQSYMAQNNLISAAETTREILSSLGIQIPRKISRKTIALELYKTRSVLDKKSDEAILSLPLMADKNDLAAVRIASSAAAAFYVGGYSAEIFFLLLKILQIAVKRGMTPQMPYWFACYGMALHTMHQLDKAFRFADIALNLKKHLDPREIRTHYIVHCYMDPWRSPLRSIPERLYEIYQHGFEVGDVEYSLLSATYWCFFSFSAGNPLSHWPKKSPPFAGQ